MSYRNREIVEQVLQRYYRSDEGCWEDVAQRVARYVAAAGVTKRGKSLTQIKASELAYYELLAQRIFIPNSPTLFNAGANTEAALLRKPLDEMQWDDYAAIKDTASVNGSLSACFVVPIDDSMASIFQAVKDAALITQSGGGVGFNFSHLRPAGSRVGSNNGVSTGPIGFMQVFNTSADVIKQGGRRRAALMGALDATHPDALRFIAAKRDNTGDSVLRYFNISLNIDADEFVRAYENDDYIELRHERAENVTRIKAHEYLHRIAENAWGSGDPGIMSVARHNRFNALRDVMPAIGTNPCGEQMLPAYGSCNLGSLVVTRAEAYGLEHAVAIAVEFLDDVVDINHFPLTEIAKVNAATRNIGLGVMGVHDWLVSKGLAYDSHAGRVAVARLLAQQALYAYNASHELALKYGAAPLFNRSRFVVEDGFIPFALWETPELERENAALREFFGNAAHFGLRNMALNTIAPTGTISQIAECSSGIEPEFALAYTRNITDGNGTVTTLNYISGIIEQMQPDTVQLQALLDGASALTLGVRDAGLYKTAMEIAPLDHLRMQATAQCYIDNSISKTVNMPQSATVDDVLAVYLTALRSGCKGVTVYRDKSLETQVLQQKQPTPLFSAHREEELHGATRCHVDNDGRKTYVTVNFDDAGKPIELFITGNGRIPQLVGRLASVAMRHGAPVAEVIKQLNRTGGYAAALADTIATIVAGNSAETEQVQFWTPSSKGFLVDQYGNTKCAECGTQNTTVLQEGCLMCTSCGYGKCS